MKLLIIILGLTLFGSSGQYDFTEPSVLEVTTGSFSDCKKMCDARVLCLDISYDRLFKICVLYKTDYRNQTRRQFPQYAKDPTLRDEQKNVTGCDECSRENCARINVNYTCMFTVCQSPIKLNDAFILGNSNAVGSMKYYECIGDTYGKYWITCRADGFWSQQNISCETNLCSLESYSLHFGLWNAEKFNTSHFYADVACLNGYDLRMTEVALCDAKTGKWFGLEWICCEKFTSSIGLKVFSYPAYTSGNIFQKYKFGENFESNGYRKWCMYRNASVFDDWVNQEIDIVTVRIIQNEEVVANLTFNGTGSTHMNWFVKDRLLQSSWHDLDDTTETQIFSISGIHTPYKTQRFLISEYTEQNESCWNDKVWLSINWSDYPCGNTSSYGAPRIIYAKDENVSRLIVDEVGFADIIDIWIRPKP